LTDWAFQKSSPALKYKRTKTQTLAPPSEITRYDWMKQK